MNDRGDKPRRGGRNRRFGPKRFRAGAGEGESRPRQGRKWTREGRGGDHRRRRDDFAHQRDLVRVAGANAVRALFAFAPDRVERLFFSRAMAEETAGYRRVLAQARKVFRETEPEDLARIAGTPMHGGVVAVARPKPVRPFDPAEAARWTESTPLLPILHGVGNPHNLGAIARTAAFLGIPRLVLTDHPAQAAISDAALRVAEGGFEALDVYRATNLFETLRRLKEHYRVLGAAVGRAGESPRALNVAPLPGRGLSPERIPRDRPVALVLGNEEEGLDAATLAACDEAVTIPGAASGQVQSLNVSVAAGILLYALRPPAR